MPAPTVGPSHLQLQQARPPPATSASASAPTYPRVQSTPARPPPAPKAAAAAAQQSRAQAQTSVQGQQQSLARKRYQEQINMQQKRAKQDNNHPRPIKQEVGETRSSDAMPILLPEESFSYEGDEDFYALFQNEPNEDEFTIKEDEFVKIDE